MKGPPAIPPKHATLGEALARAANSELGLTFTDARDEDTYVSFRTIHHQARRVAGSLAGRGIRPGDTVALVLPTSPAFVQSFFGTLLAGAIPVPLYPPVRLGRLEDYHSRTAQMLTASGASLVISDHRIRRMLGVAVEAAKLRLGCLTAEELNGDGELEYAADQDELALIQFSSGTTVDSKPVALSHANILANVAAIDAFLTEDGAPNPGGVSWLPLYHDMGLIGALLEAVYRPGPLTLIPPEVFLAGPAVWLRAISRRRATISPAPNFAYGYCTRRIKDAELDSVDLSSWTLALNGAEPVTAAVLHRFATRFARWGFREDALTPVYGLSEASLAVTFKPAHTRPRTMRVDADALAEQGVVRAGEREAISVGRPIAGIEVEIRSEDGAVVLPEHVGRIFVRGPSVMTGYYGRPELTGSALQAGWLDTGDLGFECDGELFICGRAKDVVVLRGANHAPQEFEEALDGLAGVRAGCAVAVGFLSPEEGEQLALLVETESEAADDLAEQIRGRVAARTGVRPDVVELLAPGTLPRTSSGKLRRLEARRLWQAGQLRPPNRVTALGMSYQLARGEWLLLRNALRRVSEVSEGEP